MVHVLNKIIKNKIIVLETIFEKIHWSSRDPNWLSDVVRFIYYTKRAYIIYLLCSSVLLICAIKCFTYFNNVEQKNGVQDNIAVYQQVISNILIKNLQRSLDGPEQVGTAKAFCVQCAQSLNTQTKLTVKQILMNEKIFCCDTRFIKEEIDLLLPNNVSYKIVMNAVDLVNIDYVNPEATSEKIYKVADNDLLIVVSLDNYFPLLIKMKNLTSSRTNFIVSACSVFWLINVVMAFFAINKIKKVMKVNKDLVIEVNKTKLIKLAEHESKKVTDKFYKYSTKIHQRYHSKNVLTLATDYEGIEDIDNIVDYLPIPLVDTHKVKANGEIYLINLKEIIAQLRIIVEGYVALNDVSIKFEAETKTNNLELMIDQVFFDQILISLLSNILFFAKDKKNIRYISLWIDKKTIMFKHNAFSLTEEMMIDYCRTIFYETRNPFIMHFGQMSVILNKYSNIKLEVHPGSEKNCQVNTIKMVLNGSKKPNHSNYSNVIQFSKNCHEKNL